LPLADIGAPPKEVPREARNLVKDELDKRGANVEHLYETFPFISKQSLSDFTVFWLLAQSRLKININLHWQQPGAVWAMDFLKRETDKGYGYILNVRDLSSGKVLASRPTKSQTAAESCRILEELFLIYGVPLVIKSDNGSEFIAEIVLLLLDRFCVTHLLSPAYFPQYNGACEAGGGAVMTRAMEVAATCGHPGILTIDALEAGRKIGNTAPRRGGRRSANAEWSERKTISDTQRNDFMDLVSDLQQKTTNQFIEIERPALSKQQNGNTSKFYTSVLFNEEKDSEKYFKDESSGFYDECDCFEKIEGRSKFAEEYKNDEIEREDHEIKNLNTVDRKRRDEVAFAKKCDRIGIERALSSVGILKVQKS
jgi:transposase InsO family protein